MPEYDPTIQDKLDALQALTGALRKPAELVVIYWPTPTGTKIYASAMYTQLPWWPDLADAIETYFGEPIPVTLTLIPNGTPFIDLPRAASVSDDTINLTFDDKDGEFSDLLMEYGEGIRCEVFGYWPAVDLLLSMWRGMLHQPKEMNRDQVKITATSGWRAPQMLVPKRPFATSCPFIFGAFFDTQDEIDAHKGCPYNAHIGGDIGAPGFTDCPRRVKADCVERLETETFWPGFETREDPIANNQTKGPNLLAKAIGNESALSDPIRVIAGERYVKALYLLAFRNELNNNHPEDGFGAALFAVSEGTNLAMWEFRINGELVGAEHFQIRLGALGQQPSDWSPDVNSYSGTAHCYGRIQGRFNEATASDYSGSIRVLGATDVRVYSDPDTYVEGYTTNRAWWLLHVLAHLRWGYGQDYPRFDIQSFIDAAAWCDEYVTLTDGNGNTFSGVRSTFNAEVTPRAIQQQVKDICTAGRLGLPFEFEGKDVLVPLKAEDLEDPAIPAFTDEGTSRNIVYDGAKSTLSWSVISDESLTNQWTVNFDDADNGGVDTQFIFGDQAQQLRAGRAWGDRSKRVINKSQAGYGINSPQEAVRFGNSLLYLGPLDSGGILNPFSVKFTTWYSEAFNVQNYKLIKVVNAKLQSRMAAYFTARDLEPYPDADYTYFRVMKYTRKGDLRVEIEAQQYASLDIAVVDEPCAPPVLIDTSYVRGAAILPGFVGTQADDVAVVWAYHLTPTITTPDGWELITTQTTTLAPGTPSGQSYMSAFYRVLTGSEPSDYTFTGAIHCIGGAWRGCDTADPIGAIASAGLRDDLRFDEYDIPSITTTTATSITVCGMTHSSVPADEGPESIISEESVQDYVRDANADFNHQQIYHLNTPSPGTTGTKHVVLSGEAVFFVAIVVELRPDCAAPSADFSAPRDFAATVNPTTGLVHLSWSPPAVHPEVVTGYTIYESDGVTVVMPTDFVFAFDITLAPGTYTYKVNATDGLSLSPFASVTFTVPAPPAITFNTEDFPPFGLSQTTDTEGITTIKGGAVFGASEFGRMAHVRVNGPSDAPGIFNEITTITPNSENEAVFEFIATESGVYTVQLEACFTSGSLLCNSVKPEATITVALGGLRSLLAENAGFLITEDETAFISLEF